MPKRVQDIKTPPKKRAQQKPPERPATAPHEEARPAVDTAQPKQQSVEAKREKAPWRGITPRRERRSFAQQKAASNRGRSGKPPRKGGSDGLAPRKKRKSFWLVIIAIIVGAIILASTAFAGATITITPRQEKSMIDGTFTAVRNAEGETEGLSYQMMALSDEVSTEVPAEKEEQVQEKASGRIVVYNSHSSASQRLIKNTRFETSDGKVYRTDESIVVPGTTVENGEIVPGSLEVTVYADEPGEEYNIGLTDFTIPGFKGDPRFETFYARGKTEMTGGFSGVRRTPTEDDLERARTELEEELREILTENAQAQKPDGFTLYPNAMQISFDDMHIEGSGREVTVTQRGTLRGLMFNTDVLETFIAEQVIASYEGADIRIPNLTDLDFSLVRNEQFEEQAQVQFTLSGGVTVVWEIEEDALKDLLAGVPKDQFQQALSGRPHINRAQASIRPFWKRSFPENPEDIEIEERLEE